MEILKMSSSSADIESDDTGTNKEWERLSESVLDLIVSKLVPLRDYIQFSAVCKQWCSFTRQSYSIKQRCLLNTSTRQLPLLLIPSQGNIEGRRGLYDVIMDKTYDFNLEIPFNKRISGSSHGWLLIVEKGLTLTLFNPFSGKTITLPRFDANWKVGDQDDHDHGNEAEEEEEEDNDMGYEYQIIKMALSRDPYLYPHDFELIILYITMGKLGLYKSCDKSWTCVTDHPEIGVFEDVIFYNNTFYMADHWRGLGRIDWITSDHGLQPKITKLVGHPAPKLDPLFDYIFTTYLVETTCGDLLYIVRFIERFVDHEKRWVTSNFKVYKLKTIDPPDWDEIDSLGNEALFLGDNHSTSVLAVDYGCQPNCIYYTDVFDPVKYKLYGPSDMGIYDFSDSSFRHHYKLDPEKKHMPPALWIIPSFRAD